MFTFSNYKIRTSSSDPYSIQFADNNDSGSHRSTASSGMPDFSSRRPFSRSSSKGGVGDRSGGGPTSTTSSRPPSAFENHIDYFREPVVKSPPEPTRVKSPEAVVRSPDPINWTVPLDTGKTFSVTQSIKDGGMCNFDFLYFWFYSIMCLCNRRIKN